MTIALNARALAVAGQLLADAEALRVNPLLLSCGTRVIDCGVDQPGGLEAGRLFAEVCMAGLGHVSFTTLSLGDLWLPAVAVQTDQPALACLGAQYAGWQVSHEGYFAMGSGPGRSLIRAEEALYDELGYHDEGTAAVLCLETRTLPNDPVAAYIAERAGVEPRRLLLLIAPTASLVGSVQVAARVVETAIHKLHALGFHPAGVLSAFGTCPLPPVAKSDGRAIGRTNDAILYGGQVSLTVRADDAELEALVPRVPSCTSADYGRPFYEIFKRYDNDFYKIDPLLFSPAQISVTNITSGRTFTAGSVNTAVLRESFEQ